MLLDTDILSEMTKGVNQTVAAHARAYRTVFRRYTISAVTFMEVIRGDQRKQAQAFLAAMALEEIIAFDSLAAELAGRIAGDLERTGQLIGVADPMLAATSIVNGLELVTGNTNHFERVRQVGYPLSLVDWRTYNDPRSSLRDRL